VALDSEGRRRAAVASAKVLTRLSNTPARVRPLGGGRITKRATHAFAAGADIAGRSALRRLLSNRKAQIALNGGFGLVLLVVAYFSAQHFMRQGWPLHHANLWSSPRQRSTSSPTPSRRGVGSGSSPSTSVRRRRRSPSPAAPPASAESRCLAGSTTRSASPASAASRGRAPASAPSASACSCSGCSTTPR
jgi:hypothetical protein